MSTHDLYLYRVTDVLRVVDGDTLDLRLSLGFGLSAAFRFRLAGVNAPEMYGAKAEPKGKEAALFVAAWLDEHRAHLAARTYKTSQGTVGIGDGSFGRWAADVLDVSEDGTVWSLADGLVAAGLAERSA